MSETRTTVQAIINPISGVGSKRKIPKMIQEMCQEKGYALTISFTQYPGHASELTHQAIEEGVNIIIAVGGDGTVNEIARILGVSRTQAYRLVQEGLFKSVRIGNAIRIPKRSFDKWLEPLDL